MVTAAHLSALLFARLKETKGSFREGAFKYHYAQKRVVGDVDPYRIPFHSSLFTLLSRRAFVYCPKA